MSLVTARVCRCAAAAWCDWTVAKRTAADTEQQRAHRQWQPTQLMSEQRGTVQWRPVEGRAGCGTRAPSQAVAVGGEWVDASQTDRGAAEWRAAELRAAEQSRAEESRASRGEQIGTIRNTSAAVCILEHRVSHTRNSQPTPTLSPVSVSADVHSARLLQQQCGINTRQAPVSARLLPALAGTGGLTAAEAASSTTRARETAD